MTKATYFFSDLHVSGKGPRADRLMARLKKLEHTAEAIFFVGDTFDFWLGYRSVIFSAYFDFLTQIARLIESGVQITFLTGNHDPGLSAFLEELGAKVLTHPQGVNIHGIQVYLDHGDTVDPRGPLRRLVCRLARNRVLMRVARLLHPDLAWALTRWYAQKTHTYDSGLPSGLLEDYFPERLAAGYEVVVMGHYHRAVHYRLNGGQFYGLGDWVKQFTYLRFDGAAFALMRDQEDGPDLILPEGDHGPA